MAGRVTREERDWFAFPGCGDNLDAFDLNFTEDLDDQLFAGLQAEVGKSPLAAMSFVATYPGRASIHLLEFSSAVETAGRGTGLGSVVLIEGAAPKLWTRQPVPVPGARPSKSADPVLLERTLRARLPWAAGVDEAQISAAGNRIGTAFPEELRALYRVLPVWAYEWRAGLRLTCDRGPVH